MAIQSIQRAADLLKLYSYRQPSLGITEISRRLDLPKGTVQGIVRTLTQTGLLVQERKGGEYRLGLNLYQMGAVAAATHELNQRGAGAAYHLADRTGLICRLGVWEGDGPMVILTAVSQVSAARASSFGPRVPAYCTAIGKALLANLDDRILKHYLALTDFKAYTPKTIVDPGKLLHDLRRTRKRGYSINEEEIVPGRAGIGIPIHRSGETLAGAVAISGSVESVMMGNLERLVWELRETASEISTYLGHIPGEHRQGTEMPG